MNINAEKAERLVSQNSGNPDFMIIDVRTPPENREARFHGSLLLDISSPGFVTSLQRLDRSKAYLVYCRSGNRSSNAMGLMERSGFSRVYNLKSGIIEWQAKGYPVEKG